MLFAEAYHRISMRVIKRASLTIVRASSGGSEQLGEGSGGSCGACMTPPPAPHDGNCDWWNHICCTVFYLLRDTKHVRLGPRGTCRWVSTQ